MRGEVPYDELRAAEERAKARFPEAEDVKAIWPNRLVCVEVWTRSERTGQRSAKVVRV